MADNADDLLSSPKLEQIVKVGSMEIVWPDNGLKITHGKHSQLLKLPFTRSLWDSISYNLTVV